jgi:hypothetical protein
MEWIKDNWYLIILGLVAAMFLFGHKTNKGQKGDVNGHQDETQDSGKKHKGGHSCCN